MLSETIEKRTFTEPEIAAIKMWVQKAIGGLINIRVEEYRDGLVKFIMLDKNGEDTNYWVMVNPTKPLDYLLSTEAPEEFAVINADLALTINDLKKALEKAESVVA